MSIDANDPALYDYSTAAGRPELVDQANDPSRHSRHDRGEIYERQQELRQFEKRAYDLFLQNLVKGTSHLSLGMEAVSAGFGAAMNEDDYVFATYRGHAHTLSKGVEMGEVLAELLGRENGILQGKGGSMHLTLAEQNMMGSYAIIGAHLSIANGAAWSAQSAARPGDGLLLRRRHHQHRRLPRGHQLRRGVETAGDLRVREQPLHGVHPDRHRGRGRTRRPTVRRPTVWLGSWWTATTSTPCTVAARRVPGAIGRGPPLVEAETYRHGRSLPGRSGQVPPRRGGRAGRMRDPFRAHQRLVAAGVPEVRARRRWRSGCRRGSRPVPSSPRPAAASRWGRAFTDVWADGGAMAELSLSRGRRVGIAQEMRRDPQLVMLGEDIAGAGGVFKTTRRPARRVRPTRVRDTPISEQAILGAAMGAAMTGIPVIAEIMFSDFLAVCWDFVANEIAKARYMTGGQVSVPLVVRTANGGGIGFGAQHSQSVENWCMMVPGLKVVAPSTPADVVGLMAAAIRDPDPVMFFEHKALLASKGEVPDGEHVVPLGKAKVAA